MLVTFGRQTRSKCINQEIFIPTRNIRYQNKLSLTSQVRINFKGEFTNQTSQT